LLNVVMLSVVVLNVGMLSVVVRHSADGKNQLPDSVARWLHGFLDMLCNFYLVKNHKIANNLATTEAREKYTQICNR
jgi:hypothetical protein